MDIIEENYEFELRSHTSVCKIVDRPFHWHKYYEITQVIEKNCRFLIDGKLFEASPGDLIVAGEQTTHKFIVDTDYTIVRTIQFPTKILLNVNNHIKPLKIHITSSEIEEIPELKDKLYTILSLMDAENNNAEKTEDNPFLQTLFSSLYFLLMKYFSTDEITDSKENERRKFREIVLFINENFKNNINIKTISADLFISPRKINSFFSKYAGTDLKDYINSIRIQNANRLLEQNATISEAAFESGFQCIRSFNGIYKSVMGMTPSEYITSYTKKIGSA